MTNLSVLIHIAPFDDETRSLILQKLNGNELDEDQKYQISQLCWDMIFRSYQAELSMKFDQMMEEMAEGKKNYTQHDFVEERVKLTHRLSEQILKGLESTDEEAIEEIHKRLEQFKQSAPPPGSV